MKNQLISSRDSLQKILKQEQIKEDSASLSSYGNDWLKQWKGEAEFVLFPQTTQEVTQIVLWANKYGKKLIPSGGRTGLSGGATAVQKEVVVSFDKMSKILNFNPSEQTVEVEAGVVTQSLHDFAKKKGLCLPISFASQGSSQIGGNIATNVGGVHVLRYGSMRQRVLGLEVVTGKGDILNLGRGLVKNAVGYSLKDLFIGSEGTLGFITKAILKLLPPFEHPIVFLFSVEQQEHLIELFQMFQNKIHPLAFEFFTDQALNYVLEQDSILFPLEKRSSFYILMEIENSENTKALSVFEKALEEGKITEGTMSQNSEQAQNLWKLRENISESLSSHQPYKNDISVRISKISPFLDAMEQLFKKNYPDFKVVWFGHLGDGNLHINILKPVNWSKEDFIKECEKVNVLLFSLVKKFEGTISAEHGVGLLKKAYLSYSCSDEEISMMKGIKSVFDPNHILNPGKIFD